MEILTFTSKNMDENCYAVTVNDECFIVDPGEFSNELCDFVLKNREKIKYVLFTHCHFDHVGGMRAIKDICEDALMVGHSLENDGFLNSDINLSAFFMATPISFSLDKTVLDLEKLFVGGEEIIVYHTPGHTKGSVCYKIGEFLFSGDTLFKNSYGRTDLPGGSMAELKNSLLRLSQLPKNITVYCGHGETTTIKEEFFK